MTSLKCQFKGKLHVFFEKIFFRRQVDAKRYDSSTRWCLLAGWSCWVNSERRILFIADAIQAYLTSTYTNHGRGVLTYSIYFQAELWRWKKMGRRDGHSHATSTSRMDDLDSTQQRLAPPDMHAAWWLTLRYATAILLVVLCLPRMGPVLDPEFHCQRTSGDKCECLGHQRSIGWCLCLGRRDTRFAWWGCVVREYGAD